MGRITAPSGPLATPREAKRISACGPPEGDGAAGWPGVGAGAPRAGPPGEPGATPPLAAAPATDPLAASLDRADRAVADVAAGTAPPGRAGAAPAVVAFALGAT